MTIDDAFKQQILDYFKLNIYTKSDLDMFVTAGILTQEEETQAIDNKPSSTLN